MSKPSYGLLHGTHAARVVSLITVIHCQAGYNMYTKRASAEQFVVAYGNESRHVQYNENPRTVRTYSIVPDRPMI